MIEQLQQLCTVTWDGNLLSKDYRTELIKSGLAQRWNGYNFITLKGIRCLAELNLLPKRNRA